MQAGGPPARRPSDPPDPAPEGFGEKSSGRIPTGIVPVLIPSPIPCTYIYSVSSCIAAWAPSASTSRRHRAAAHSLEGRARAPRPPCRACADNGALRRGQPAVVQDQPVAVQPVVVQDQPVAVQDQPVAVQDHAEARQDQPVAIPWQVLLFSRLLECLTALAGPRQRPPS